MCGAGALARLLLTLVWVFSKDPHSNNRLGGSAKQSERGRKRFQ